LIHEEQDKKRRITMNKALRILGSSLLGVIILSGCGNTSDETTTETTTNEQQEMQNDGERPDMGGERPDIEEMSEEEILKMAEQAGIDTEGKTIEEVQEELKENQPEMGEGGPMNEEDLIKKAEEAGIDTDGKTTEEIMEELGMGKPEMNNTVGNDEL
jgi:predicted RNase H-like HicB family nuclease